MTARTRLRHALKGSDPARIEGLAAVAGVPARIVKRAGKGEPIAADSYLRICAAMDLDPVTLLPCRGLAAGAFHWVSFGAATRAKRMRPEGDLPLRRAAKIAKLSFAALGRAERGEVVSIETVLTVCKYIGRHPADFVSRADASRETPTGTKVAA